MGLPLGLGFYWLLGLFDFISVKSFNLHSVQRAVFICQKEMSRTHREACNERGMRESDCWRVLSVATEPSEQKKGGFVICFNIDALFSQLVSRLLLNDAKRRS